MTRTPARIALRIFLALALVHLVWQLTDQDTPARVSQWFLMPVLAGFLLVSTRGAERGRLVRLTLAALFFSEELQDIAAAKRLCATCPAMVQCLEGAMARREPWGVWGGQLFLNGKILASKRRRGRPPKVARPEDQLPEIPIPEHLRSA